MHFNTKSYLKSTRNHTAKHAIRTEKRRAKLKFFMVYAHLINRGDAVKNKMSSRSLILSTLR